MLKGVIAERNALESSKGKNAFEVVWLVIERREAIALADAAKFELRQVTDMFTGKP